MTTAHCTAANFGRFSPTSRPDEVSQAGSTMKNTGFDEVGRWSSEELLLRVAWFYYKDELTQDEIARRLSVSRASVGRMLDRARRIGLVTINLSTEYLDAFELSRRLRDTFGLDEALVVPGPAAHPSGP